MAGDGRTDETNGRRQWAQPAGILRRENSPGWNPKQICLFFEHPKLRSCAMGYILLWLLGIPIPIIIILALLWH